MTGWISLHRQIRNHWIWDDAEKLKWWLDILLLTNHTDKKSLYNNEVILIKRGTFKTSEVKLSERWGVSRNTIRKFLKLLESDEMITTEKTPYGTTIKVLNYNDYQGFSMREKQVSEQPLEQQNEQHKDTPVNNSMNSNVNTTNNYNTSNNELIMNNNDNNDKKTDQSVGVVFDKFQELGFGTINGFTAEQINEHLQTFEPEVVIKALEVASNNNKRNMSYANGILRNWQQRNIITLEDVKAAEQQREVEQTSGYNKFTMNRAAETRPKWLDEEKEKKRVNIQDLKTVTEDAELSDLISKFREN